MTDRPIIFSAPMVRALLDGRKTQTRRILKPQPEATWRLDPARWHTARVGSFWFTDDPDQPGNHCISARFAPGDRLWVRETCGTGGYFPFPWAYRADGKEYPGERWTPPIHMPRRASRLTLIVEAVKVERLQDISEDDATAEGCEAEPDAHSDYTDQPGVTAREEFHYLWGSINGDESWRANPWVVAVTFRVIKGNIDNVHYTSAETLRAVLDPTTGSDTLLSAAAAKVKE